MGKKNTDTISFNKDSEKANGELWSELKAGNLQAFETIYRTYIQIVYNYSRKLSDDQELIEDCIQDLFADIWKSRQNLGNVVSIQYYLYSSIKRKIIKARRKRIKYLENTYLLHEYQHEHAYSCENDLICLEESRIQKKNLMAGLHSLNHVQRKAIILKFYRDLSYQEVAEKMSIKVGNVYKIISRGLKNLETKIAKTSVDI